jgi:phenylacetic acid degradation operon negative regulatory protein
MSTQAPTRPVLQPQDLVLTILAVHLRTPRAQVWSGGAVELLGELGFSTEAARAALARLASRGLLERHKEGRLVFYTLTTRAEELLSDGDRRIYSFGRSGAPGHAWTMVWHAMPETHRVARSRLASRLRFLGFGPVQDGTWVAAHDREPEARAVLRDLDVEEFASVFVGRLSRDAPPTALIAQAWDVDAAAEQYRGFIADYGPLRDERQARRLSDREAFATRTVMYHRFRDFPAIDPELPPDIDPLRPLRSEALEIFDVVRESLAVPANDHFVQAAEHG